MLVVCFGGAAGSWRGLLISEEERVRHITTAANEITCYTPTPRIVAERAG